MLHNDKIWNEDIHSITNCRYNISWEDVGVQCAINKQHSFNWLGINAWHSEGHWIYIGNKREYLCLLLCVWNLQAVMQRSVAGSGPYLFWSLKHYEPDLKSYHERL